MKERWKRRTTFLPNIYPVFYIVCSINEREVIYTQALRPFTPLPVLCCTILLNMIFLENLSASPHRLTTTEIRTEQRPGNS